MSKSGQNKLRATMDYTSMSSMSSMSEIFDSETLRTSQSLRSSEMMVVEPTSRVKRLTETALQDFTINKLKIKSIGLVGREKETEVLRSCLKSMMDQEGAKDKGTDAVSDSSNLVTSKVEKKVVFLKGYSGVGKTSLARAIQKDVCKKYRGYYVEGKFDLNDAKDQPYLGIAKAFSDVFQQLAKEENFVLLEIGKQLCTMLGAEVEPLTYLIPELEDVVNEYTTSVYSDGNIDGMQERWKYSFRVLTRLLTSQVKPLVMMIDDLQWADQASLDMIDALICDSQNVNPLMIIGCYRSNEVTETSILSKSMQSLMDRRSKFGFDVTDISLESCGIKEVNQMINRMMDTDDEMSTRDLADLCYQRTLGNPFFVISYMTMLQKEELITFSIGSMKWGYDIAEIENTTVSTANVVDLVKSRMQNMPEDVQLLLRVAACLGPSFRVSILQKLWKNLSFVESKGFRVNDISTMIAFIEDELLIEAWTGDKYRWVHDKVQEAALLLTDVEVVTLKFEMGKVLFYNLFGRELEDELFDVVDLVSAGNDRKSAEFALLCLRAAKKAKRLSAFHSATGYVQNGIGMLPDDTWITNPSLPLELYTLGAQVELALGHVEESQKYCSFVLDRQEVEFGSKLPLRLVETKRLATVELKYADAIKSGLALLKDMKYKLIWTKSLVPVQALSVLSKTMKAVKKLPKDFYLSMGRMGDKYVTITDILERIQYASFHTGELTQMILCDCHIVQLSIQHGLCEHSAHCLAMIGVYASLVFQSFKDSSIFRNRALSMQRHWGKTRACQTIFMAYEYSLVWTVPLETCTSVFYDAYMRGMQNGEVDFAMWSLNSHFVSLPYFLGKPFDQVLEEFPKIVAQMEEVSQTSQALTVKCFWQMFINLRYPQKDQDPTVLKGEIHNMEETEADLFLSLVHDYVERQLLIFYDHESAADRAIKGADVLQKCSPGSFQNMIETFHRAICLYAAARRTKKRKYRQHARKIRKQILKWKEAGIPNVVYYCIFLDAEEAALRGKDSETERYYKEAIQFVARSGYLHHAALFNEMYSDYLSRERKDLDEAKYRLQEAIRYYGDWGALGKVEKLKESSLLQ